jgi:adenylate cyclase class IV
MKDEVEAKSIQIDKEEIRKKLKDLGCKLEFKEKKFVRKTFQLPSSTPFIDTSGIWARLRTDGKKTDLALKIYSEKMKWAKEIECRVEDFKVINEFIDIQSRNIDFGEYDREVLLRIKNENFEPFYFEQIATIDTY